LNVVFRANLPILVIVGLGMKGAEVILLEIADDLVGNAAVVHAGVGAVAKTDFQTALGEGVELLRLKVKGSASDLVQETFLEAQRDFAGFHGESDAELRAWLRQLLLNNLANFRRRYRATGKRQIGREIPLEADSSSAGPAREVAGDTPTPSQTAMEQEEAEAVRRAMDRLPEDLRRVLILRHHEGRTFEEIGRLMSRSTNGARTLWLRPVERLNHELEASP
jgi:RNA polymerase sigma-70 factor (ECF subfamily)